MRTISSVSTGRTRRFTALACIPRSFPWLPNILTHMYQPNYILDSGVRRLLGEPFHHARIRSFPPATAKISVLSLHSPHHVSIPSPRTAKRRRRAHRRLSPGPGGGGGSADKLPQIPAASAWLRIAILVGARKRAGCTTYPARHRRNRPFRSPPPWARSPGYTEAAQSSVPGGLALDEVVHAGRVHLHVDAGEAYPGAPVAKAHFPDLVALTGHRVEQRPARVAEAGILALLAGRNHGARVVHPTVGLARLRVGDHRYLRLPQTPGEVDLAAAVRRHRRGVAPPDDRRQPSWPLKEVLPRRGVVGGPPTG